MIYKSKNTYGKLIREFRTLDNLRETFPATNYRPYSDLFIGPIADEGVHLYIDTTSFETTLEGAVSSEHSELGR